MFLLLRHDLPQTPEALAAALDEGLRAFVSRPAPMVSIAGDKVSALKSIAVDLSGARAESARLPPRPRLDNLRPAISATELSVTAEPISLFGAAVNFQLKANEVQLQQAPQPDDKSLLILHRAQAGDLRLETGRAELEHLIKRVAGKLAQKQGVTIESVNLQLAQPQPRVLDAIVTVAARKLLFRPVLKLAGSVTINDDLVATISNLTCTGDGPIASLACAAITPQFARIEARPFPLSALPLGEIQLRDVTLDLIGDRISIAAKFGERSASA
ncbi:MAG: hypothetical protein DLM52_06330 [Chthoniobacterales bacterium]|nr:MAG: hypothetical protein DLM52_06330 [Chthoniobacterales bacterium]